MQPRRAKRQPTSLPLRFDPLEPRLLFAAVPTSISLTQSAPLITPSQSLTLTARVSADDGSIPTGTVAFLDKSNTIASDQQLVHFLDPATGQYSFLSLLGSAPLDAAGVASLPITTLPAPTHEFRAVYLGSDDLLWPRTSGGLPVFPPPAETNFPITMASDRFWGPVEYYSKILLPSPHPFQLHFQDLTYLDSLPDGVTPSDPAGVFNQENHDFPYYDSAPAYFAPITQPLRVLASYNYSAHPGTWNDTLRSAVTYTLSPATVDPVLSSAANDVYQTSVSAGHALAADQPTSLSYKFHGTYTPTNPPVIAVNLADLAGISYSRKEPTVTVPGTYNSAYAGLAVQLTGPGGGGGGGSGAAGVIVIGNPLPQFTPQGPFPTGTVSFYDGDTLLGSSPVDPDGNALFQPPARSLSLGTHQLRAVYSGDAYYGPTESAVPEFTLTKTTTATQFVNLPNSVYSDSALSLFGKVTTDRDTVTPTGTLTFSVDGQILATLTLSPSPDDPLAPAVPLGLSLGTHTLTLSYSGDDDCLPHQYSRTLNITQRPTPPGGGGVIIINPPPPPFGGGGGVIIDPPGGWVPPGHIPGIPHFPDPILRPTPILIPSFPVLNQIDDLELRSVSPASTTARPGETLGINTDVNFIGTNLFFGTSAPISLFLSTDDVAGNADDVPIGSFSRSMFHVGLIAFRPDGHIVTLPDHVAMLPEDLPAGTYRLLAIVDHDNAIAETDESNNALFSSQPITVYQPTFGATLQARRAKLKTGSTADLSLTLSNRTKKPVHYKYAVKYYFSSDDQWSPDDVPFTTQTLDVSLGKHQTRRYPLSYTIPATTPVGTTHIVAVGDRAQGGGRSLASIIRAATAPLQITGPHLTASVVSVKPTKRLDTSRVTLRLINDGDTLFHAPATLHLLTDTPDANTLLATLTKRLKLKPGKSFSVTFTAPRTPFTDFRAEVSWSST